MKRMFATFATLVKGYGLFSRSAGIRPLTPKDALLGMMVGRPITPFPKITARFFSQGIQLPLGYDNFREVIDAQLRFVDKSLLIQAVIDDRATKVAVITRPRRFGKTFNLSMLEHFLAAKVHGQPTAGLFNHLKISQIANGAYMQYQGKYPVVALTFKDIKSAHYDLAYDKLFELIVATFNEHHYLRQSERLSEGNKDLYNLILNRKANRSQIEKSLQFLTSCLFEHHGIKPWLLIDEYDTPIQSGYVYGYYDEMIHFMRGLFSAALKTNPYLERAVITGILRVSKESLFSGLNNVEIYSLLREEFSEYFGFTEEEIDELLQLANLTEKSQEIKRWYNGYQFGKTIIYNPWSIVNCIKRKGELQPYWLNTSDNTLIKTLFAQADEDTKIKLESLIRNEPVEAIIDEYVAFVRIPQELLPQFNLAIKHLWHIVRAYLMMEEVSDFLSAYGAVSMSDSGYEVMLGGDTGGVTLATQKHANNDIVYKIGKANGNEDLLFAAFILLAHFLTPENVRVYDEAEDDFFAPGLSVLVSYRAALKKQVALQSVFSIEEIQQLEHLERTFLYLYGSDKVPREVLWKIDDREKMELSQSEWERQVHANYDDCTLLACQSAEVLEALSHYAETIQYHFEAAKNEPHQALLQRMTLSLNMDKSVFLSLLSIYLRYMPDDEAVRLKGELINIAMPIAFGDDEGAASTAGESRKRLW